MSIIDFVTIIPYYIELIIYVSQTPSKNISFLAVLRILRLLRVLRILRVARFLQGVRAVIRSLFESWRPFATMFFILLVGLFVMSTLEYYAEQMEETFHRKRQVWTYDHHSLKPGVEGPFQSIPHTMWWGMVTMTTEGYGDNFPITPTGKLVAGVTMLVGIMVSSRNAGIQTIPDSDILGGVDSLTPCWCVSNQIFTDY